MSISKSLMKRGWRECKLGDTVEIEMGQSPKSESCNLSGQGLPLLNGPTEFGIKHPLPVQYTVDEKRKAFLGDLLFCVRGSTTGRMNWADQTYAIGRGIAAIRHNDDSRLNCYVRGLIDYNLQNLLSSASGSVFPNVTAQQIKDVDILLPPLPEQRAIASVLSSLDDKIDLLHRQNKTLESLAETLFRQWFIEEADEGWEDGKLGDVIELVYGKALKDEDRTGVGFPVVGSSGVVGYHSEYLVEGPGIVIGRKGTLGKVIYLYDNFSPIDTTYYIKSKVNSTGLLYEYFLLKTLNLEEMNSDSAVPGLNRDIALSTEVKIAPYQKLVEFNLQCAAYLEKLKDNSKQSYTLEQLRDALLPKLMSGEVTIKE